MIQKTCRSYKTQTVITDTGKKKKVTHKCYRPKNHKSRHRCVCGATWNVKKVYLYDMLGNKMLDRSGKPILLRG